MATMKKTSGKLAHKGAGKGRKWARGRTEDGAPNPIDAHVGARVRLRRTLLGLSQEGLAEAIGLSFQQVQKYERGASRISASRLHDLAQVLDVPYSFFFDGMNEETKASSPAQMQAGTAVAVAQDPDPLTKRETLELVRAYYRISDAAVRKRVFELAKALCSTAEGAENG